MVFSTAAINNTLSSLKAVNSSSIKANRISSKPLDAKQSMSGQVPCYLSPGCFPDAACWGACPPPSQPWFTCSEDVTLSSFYSCWAFLEHECKEAYHSRSGKLPVVPSTTQKAFKSQINGAAQGNVAGCFWCSWSIVIGHGQQHKAYSDKHMWLFG